MFGPEQKDIGLFTNICCYDVVARGYTGGTSPQDFMKTMKPTKNPSYFQILLLLLIEIVPLKRRAPKFAMLHSSPEAELGLKYRFFAQEGPTS